MNKSNPRQANWPKRSKETQSGSPVEYAQGAISNTAGPAAPKAAVQAKRQGEKALERIRERDKTIMRKSTVAPNMWN